MHTQRLSDAHGPTAAPQKQKPPRPRRRRTLSAVSIPTAGSDAKIALLNPVAPLDPRSTEQHGAAGAFTLTGCARASLRGLAPGLHMRADSIDSAESLRRAGFVRPRPPMPGDSPPASPATSFASIPSISRTTSPFSYTEVLSDWKGKERERERKKGRERERPPALHPVLDLLERGSLVGTGRVVCAACNKPGMNFPRCKRCAKMWCSRECRTAPVHRCVGVGGACAA
ncbi:hypothetical protein B0H10DRAFT_2430612 [Mycena sp. CBHHK59/15]|nr:hypothetical protein B0H10DRAFT_2430612 [Mycena sp. CBHHK59/15]